MRLSKEDRETLIGMHENGFDANEIAYALNLTEYKVKRCIQHYFGPKRKNAKRVDPDTADKAWDLYQEGLKPWLIAQKLGIESRQVSAIAGYRKRKMFEMLRKY